MNKITGGQICVSATLIGTGHKRRNTEQILGSR